MPRELNPTVYIMANRYRGTIYTGVTSDLYSRVVGHRNGTFAGFSAKYKTHTLVWYENHDDMASAIIRETRIKAWRRQWKFDLIETINRDWLDLSENLVHRPAAETPTQPRHSKRSRDLLSKSGGSDLEPRFGHPSWLPDGAWSLDYRRIVT